MLSLIPVVNLLKAVPQSFVMPWFRAIGGAAEYAQAIELRLPLPMAWVIRSGDDGRSIGCGSVDVDVIFDVVIAIENARGKLSGEVDDNLLIYRRAVFALLSGTDIKGAVKPIEYMGGAVIDYTDFGLYYRDRYKFSGMLANYAPSPTDVMSL